MLLGWCKLKLLMICSNLLWILVLKFVDGFLKFESVYIGKKSDFFKMIIKRIVFFVENRS